MADYKYNIGEFVYTINVNDALIVKLTRSEIQGRWKSGNGRNIYKLITRYNKTIKTYQVIKTEFKNPYAERKYKQNFKESWTVESSSNESNIIRDLRLSDIKRAIRRRKKQLQKALDSRPLCFFTGKPLNYYEDVMELCVMDGPAKYKPEGVENIIYNRWPRNSYINKNVYYVNVSSGSYKNKNFTTKEYKLVLDNGVFRELEEVPNHRKILAFDYHNANGRHYPEENVEIDENRDYLVEFDMPENGTIKLTNTCAYAKLAKNKDYLYIKEIKFLRETIVDRLRAGLKINLSGFGTVDKKTNAVNKDFKIIGLFLGVNSSFNF